MIPTKYVVQNVSYLLSSILKEVGFIKHIQLESHESWDMLPRNFHTTIIIFFTC